MTVRELIKELESLPEHSKDLPLRAEGSSRNYDTYTPNDVRVSYDDCQRRCVIIGRK
jgi:hypothetical protein